MNYILLKRLTHTFIASPSFYLALFFKKCLVNSTLNDTKLHRANIAETRIRRFIQLVWKFKSCLKISWWFQQKWCKSVVIETVTGCKSQSLFQNSRKRWRGSGISCQIMSSERLYVSRVSQDVHSSTCYWMITTQFYRGGRREHESLVSYGGKICTRAPRLSNNVKYWM